MYIYYILFYFMLETFFLSVCCRKKNVMNTIEFKVKWFMVIVLVAVTLFFAFLMDVF